MYASLPAALHSALNVPQKLKLTKLLHVYAPWQALCVQGGVRGQEILVLTCGRKMQLVYYDNSLVVMLEDSSCVRKETFHVICSLPQPRSSSEVLNTETCSLEYFYSKKLTLNMETFKYSIYDDDFTFSLVSISSN